MTRFVLRRAAAGVLMLWLVSVLIFVVLRLLPGDPTIQKVGIAPGIDRATIAAVRHQLGLDAPVIVQYGRWLGGLVRGDLGQSYFSQYAVTELIGARLGPTLQLAVAGLVLGVLIAVPLAMLGGRLVALYTTLGMAAPAFIFGILLIAVFNVRLGWIPLTGYISPLEDPLGSLRAVLLPALTLAITVSAPLIRYLRASMDDVRRAPFVRTAIGKGARPRTVLAGHVLPNALLPALTALGVIVGSVLGGVVVVEYVFRWQGLGSLIVDAVFKRDYAVLQSAVLLAAVAFVLANLLVDILYGVLDPRLRAEATR